MPDFEEPEINRRLHPSTTALVVIDMQNDFIHAKGASSRGSSVSSADRYNGQSLEDRLPAIIDTARRHDVVIVFVRMINDLVYLSPPVAERLDRIGLLGIGLQSNTWGADYFGDVRPDETRQREFEIVKHRYSAFHGTNLAQLLRSNEIRTLLFAGVSTSGCVESTAREALFNDFYGVILSDCVADSDPESHHATLRKYSRSFGEVMSSDNVAHVWKIAEA